jgi:hypothetical protein
MSKFTSKLKWSIKLCTYTMPNFYSLLNSIYAISNFEEHVPFTWNQTQFFNWAQRFLNNIPKPKPKGLKIWRTKLKLAPKKLTKNLKYENQDQRFSSKGRTQQLCSQHIVLCPPTSFTIYSKKPLLSSQSALSLVRDFLTLHNKRKARKHAPKSPDLDNGFQHFSQI